MGYILKAICLLLHIGFQVVGGSVTPLGVIGLLVLTALWIYREKYYNLLTLLIIEGGVIMALAFTQPSALILCGVLAFDLAAGGRYWLVPLLLPGGAILLQGQDLVFYLMLLTLGSLGGHLKHTLDEREQSFREVFDAERRNRYSLEEAKVRLLNSAREAAHLAEIKERNRIAREIHDSLGHSLAGILLQLQAAVKTLDRDEQKAKEMLAASVAGLAESVNLLRDTVHNIRPREQLGLDYYQRIISNFNFCPVDFQHSGDLSLLSASHAEIISALLKESLTNASRHSKATKIEVNLEVRNKIIRLYIKDNGVGCGRIQEGMGISGMRERVRNAGGTISLGSDNGFRIVAVLPRYEGGGEIFASYHS